MPLSPFARVPITLEGQGTWQVGEETANARADRSTSTQVICFTTSVPSRHHLGPWRCVFPHRRSERCLSIRLPAFPSSSMSSVEAARGTIDNDRSIFLAIDRVASHAPRKGKTVSIHSTARSCSLCLETAQNLNRANSHLKSKARNFDGSTVGF